MVLLFGGGLNESSSTVRVEELHLPTASSANKLMHDDSETVANASK